jgi:hypothetical protein
MEQMPEIGARVEYKGKYPNMFGGAGVVVKHYPGGERSFDEEEMDWYITPDRVAVVVDKKPVHWPYPDENNYCPNIDEIELI